MSFFLILILNLIPSLVSLNLFPTISSFQQRWNTKQDALQAIHSPFLDDVLSPSSLLRTATLEAIRDVRLPSKRNGKVPASIWDALSEGMTKHKHNFASPSEEMAEEFLGARPTGGSNNWVISGKLTKSGSPIMASDPHLEINRLPAIWYEVVLHRSWEDTFALGITVPGVPGLIMGRSSFMSWSFTYGFMDMIDFFLEKCSGLTCTNENSVEVKMTIHRETILRKGATPIDLVVYETPRGDSLEVNDTYITSKDEIPRLESGIYLARAYTHQRWLAGAPSLRSLLLLGRSKTVQDAQNFAKNVELSLNLLFADTEGNIGYQQTGLMPDRPQGRSGLSPFLGWLPGSDWKPTRLPADRLGRLFNPSSGFIATANDDEHTLREPVSVNLHMGGYRRERIEELLKSSITRKEPFDINDMKWIQRDILSLQARRYTGLVDTLLDELKLVSLRPLRDWDLRYTYNSFGAGIFEEFYTRLMDEVFTVPFEKDLWHHLKGSYLVRPYFHLYDKLIFQWNNQERSGDSGEVKGLFWEEGRTKEDVYRKVLLEMAKNETQEGARQQYFEDHSVTFHNILFEEKIPRMTALFGYDQGPILLPGGRATIVQHVSFKGATGKVGHLHLHAPFHSQTGIPGTERRIPFRLYFLLTHPSLSFFVHQRIVVGPSWRHISEMSEGGVSLTSLPGGPSDQVLSELYANDLHRWANFRYKRLPRFETEKA
jgi:acyl-homoserine lactone acylase PvdQ